MVEKMIRDGKVAVLYSPGFGAGWSTWNTGHKEFLLFDRRLVKFVENKNFDGLCDYIENLYDNHIYLGGAYDLQIAWLDEGTRFRIREYDGSESIIFAEDSETA